MRSFVRRIVGLCAGVCLCVFALVFVGSSFRVAFVRSFGVGVLFCVCCFLVGVVWLLARLLCGLSRFGGLVV